MRNRTRGTDQEYLRADEYRDSRNLSARGSLHARFSTHPQRRLHWVFEHLRIPVPAQILELGCGPAGLWQENLARIPAAWEITLSDFSPGMVKDAQRALAGAAHPFRYQVIDAQSIPFGDDSFDAVIADHMLYHVPDVPRALAEIRRVLRPEGRLFAATNGRGHMRELWHFLAAYGGKPERASRATRNFDLKNGEELLAAHFAQVELTLYNDALEVTEADPLIAYVMSMLEEELVSHTEQEPERFRAHVTEHLAHGPFHIGKAIGLFEAWG